MNQIDLSPTRLRAEGEKRLRAALAAYDPSDIAAAPLTRWVSAAPARQNRALGLKIVIATTAARTTSGPVLKACGIARATQTRWAKIVHTEGQASAAFEQAFTAAVEAVRARTLIAGRQVQAPPPLGTAKKRRHAT